MKLLIRILETPILLLVSALMTLIIFPCIFIDLIRRPLSSPLHRRLLLED